ncbi:MAG: flagellar biosynthesis anti-sigma factor FlgM [Methylovulum sp.]|jgi:negative regulator of flagellin synthesis FlgM|nr:flagellar biosynthesis anti-sigma factor FlgM [Methylovulum sp.]TSA41755.1 MAG: flagellar biosynthesis anti-sigma factor FlgM [Methylococcaceae bacterium]
MTIESINGRLQTPLASKSAPKNQPESTKTDAVSNIDTDDVSITTMAQGIKKAFESSSASESFDLEKVNSVKKALSEGSYVINAERIAKKMLEFELALP